MFSGSIVALITPFSNGMVDEKKLQQLIKFHVDSGTDGIAPCGTTGESATLSDEEKGRIFEIAVKTANKKVPVIAGTGTNNTQHVIHLSKIAKQKGADAVLLVTPYYNKPTQEGLFQHYKAVCDEVDIPVILYNVPGRTGVNLLPATVIRLMNECSNIIGVKEASCSTDQSTEILSAAGSKFCVLSGDDSMTLPLMALGASGVISVVANIAPGDVSSMCKAVKAGNWPEARRLHQKLYPLVKACFIETNPMPVKTACELMGLASSEVRLPLCAMQKETKEKLIKTMRSYGLLKEKVF